MAAAKAHNSFNIADMMASLTVSKKEADKMDVEIKNVIKDVSRPNTVHSLSRLRNEIDREIQKLTDKMKKLVDTLERDERRLKRANANERLEIQTNKLQLQASLRDVRKLLEEYHEKMRTVSDSLEMMKRIAQKEAKKHRNALKEATKHMAPKEKKEHEKKYKQYVRNLAQITGDFSMAFFNSNSNSNSNRNGNGAARGAMASRRRSRSRSKSRSRSRSPGYGGATRRNNRSTRRK